MREIKDLTGKTFNGIKVIDYFGQDKHGNKMYIKFYPNTEDKQND